MHSVQRTPNNKLKQQMAGDCIGRWISWQRDGGTKLTGVLRSLDASASSSFFGALWNEARSVFLLPAADAADPPSPPPGAARLFLPVCWLLPLSSGSLSTGHFVSMFYGQNGCRLQQNRTMRDYVRKIQSVHRRIQAR